MTAYEKNNFLPMHGKNWAEQMTELVSAKTL
jgi:hypothetical protein